MERQLSVTPAKKVLVVLPRSARHSAKEVVIQSRTPGPSTLRPSFPRTREPGDFGPLQARGRLWVPGLARGRRIVCPLVGSRQLVEQPLRFFQVGGVEALGEPAVDGRQQLARLALPALLPPQPGEARGRAQFVAACALLAGDRQGGAERLLGLGWIGVWQSTG